jgi:hypothetical protein
METCVYDTGRRNDEYWPANCPPPFSSLYDGGYPYPTVVDPIGGCRTNFTYDPGPHPAASEPASAPPILTSDYPACVGNMVYDAYRPPAPAVDKTSGLAEFVARVACVTGGACDSSLAADEPIIVPVRPAVREK